MERTPRSESADGLMDDLLFATKMERQSNGKKASSAPMLEDSEIEARLRRIVDDVAARRSDARAKRRRGEDGEDGEEDEEEGQGEDAERRELSRMARFNDFLGLDRPGSTLSLIPRLVNVVTLAEAFPVPHTNLSLPLDLNWIASRCTGAYFAPRRFAAVQLAYTTPRARVLIFHTGRFVGTGTSGPMAARLAISRAQHQLNEQAGLKLHLKNFSVINQVGAVSLGMNLNCNAFADAHSSDAHFDRNSFVGLAWRPANESICCEIYGSGRANLPGSTRMRDLLDSWNRMHPSLRAFSHSSSSSSSSSAHPSAEAGAHDGQREDDADEEEQETFADEELEMLGL